MRRPLAAAVEAISRSAKRGRLVRPTARTAAKIRPYSRAAFVSNGKGSQVAAAHCSRSCRRALSCSSPVACGPAASSARVTAAMADSSGSRLGSTTSRSITTEVSSKPWGGRWVGSAIKGRVYYGIQSGTEPPGINPRSPLPGFRNCRPWHEPMRVNRPELGNRHPVAGHNHGFARLYFPEHGRRLIAEFTLGNSSVHDETVAYVALCSHTLSTAEQARHAFTSHLARRGRLPLLLGHAGQPLHLRGVQFQTFSHPGPVIGISLEEDGALPELDALLRAAQVSADVTHQVGTVFVRHNVPIEVARLDEVIIGVGVFLPPRLAFHRGCGIRRRRVGRGSAEAIGPVVGTHTAVVV